jgi:hypothetical protein
LKILFCFQITTKLYVKMTECPICMELIEADKNIIITECGHKFHCKCLMLNVEHNGFGCPYCRQEMIPEMDDDNEDEYEDDNEDEDANEDEDEDHDEADNDNDNDNDNILDGVRWLFMRAEEENLEQYDSYTDTTSEESYTETDLPSAGLISQYLCERRGVTIEELIKCLLSEDTRYINSEQYYNDYIRTSNKIYGKINSIIYRYQNEY